MLVHNPFDTVHISSSSTDSKTAAAADEENTRPPIDDPAVPGIAMSPPQYCSSSSPHHDDEMLNAVFRCTDLCIELGDYPEAETLIRSHLSFMQSTLSKISLMNTLSSILCHQDKLEAAIDALVQAHDLIQALPKDDCITTHYYGIVTRCKIAFLLSKNKKVEKAVLMFQDALAKIGSFGNQKHSVFFKIRIEIHRNISQIYESIGMNANAIYHLQQISAIVTEIYGPMDSLVSSNLNQLGLLYYRNQEYKSALSAFLQCLQICTNNHSKNERSQLIDVLYNIAATYKAMGMAEDALKIHFKILDYERQTMAETEIKKPTGLIAALGHIFETYANQEQDMISKHGLPYLFEAVGLCRQYKDKIDSHLGQNVFILLGKYLTLNGKVIEGFRYYCEGCELFGEVDLDTFSAEGENGICIILDHLCTNTDIFPQHAAAA